MRVCVGEWECGYVCVWVRISVTIRAASLAQITSAAVPDCILFSCFAGAYAQNQHQWVNSAVTGLQILKCGV